MRTRLLILLLLFSPTGLAVNRPSLPRDFHLGPDPKLKPLPITATELASLLRVDTRACDFYDSNVSYRLVMQDHRGVQEINGSIRAPEAKPGQPVVPGRILYFLRKGELQLVVRNGDVVRDHRVPLPEDALWYGWRGHRGSIDSEQPCLDKEFILYSMVAEELNDRGLRVEERGRKASVHVYLTLSTP